MKHALGENEKEGASKRKETKRREAFRASGAVSGGNNEKWRRRKSGIELFLRDAMQKTTLARPRPNTKGERRLPLRCSTIFLYGVDERERDRTRFPVEDEEEEEERAYFRKTSCGGGGGGGGA